MTVPYTQLTGQGMTLLPVEQATILYGCLWTANMTVDGPSYNLLLKKEKAHEMDVNSVQWSPNGTISFGAGFFFVVIGWPIIGMMLETNGFFVLFSGFWPTVAVFAQKIPILGWIIQQPYIRSFFDKYRGKRVLQAVIGRPQACSFHYV